MALLNMNVGNEVFKNLSAQMGISEFPYIVVYFNGERDHNIHGPANKETSTQILNELYRIQPKQISINTTKADNVSISAKDIPAESKDAHDAHGSPSAALNANVAPSRSPAPKPQPAAANQTVRPAQPQPRPQPIP